MYEFYHYYMSINLKNYPNICYDMKVGWVLLALTVGVMLAAVFITLQRNSMISLIKKLSRTEATSEESARTLKELGLDNLLVRGLIKSSGRVKRLVTYVGKKELSYEEYIEATKSKRRFFGLIKKKEKPEEATKEESSVKLEKIDFTTAKFYLCDRESEETKNLVDARKTSILNMVLFCILILCIFVFLMVLMPSILNVIDDFLANSKVK